MDWSTIGTLLALMTAWGGIVLWAVKAMLGRLEQKLDADTGEWRRVERGLNDLRAELPRDYVRREDWIRFGAGIDAKIDRVHDRLDELTKEIHERQG